MSQLTTVTELELERGRAELYKRLYNVTAALSKAASAEEVVGVMFVQGLAVLAATGGFLGIVSERGDQLDIQRFAPDSGGVVEHVLVPLDSPLPIAASSRDGKIRLIASNEQLACDFPGLHRLNPADHACATVPIMIGDRIWGAMNIAFEPAQPFTSVGEHLMTMLAEHCGDALERTTRLHETERQQHKLRALRLHDDVIQDLITAQAALDQGLADDAAMAVSNALAAARRIADRAAE
ncbi:MAG: GAF domain-containing protein [Thermoleophilia bacterium]|nr:GAF domain-containing protein [Thermoleophilia bacterium]